MLHRLLVAVATVVAGLSAQKLPVWSSLPFDKKTSHFSEATIVVVQEPGKVHCYSSFTRGWRSLATSPAATYKGYDDHAIVQDGTTFWAYSTRYGRFAPLATANGQLVNTPAQAWLSIVTDGNDAWHYSTLVDTWSRVRFNGPSTGVAARLVAVLTDGQATSAVSAHHGPAVPVTTAGSVTIDAVGLCGIARDAQSVHLFSAYRNRWTTIPVSSAATVVKPPNRASFVVIRDGTAAIFYSAVTGTTVTATLPQTAAVTLGDDVACFADSVVPLLYCYSGITGTIVSKAVPAQRTVTVRRYHVLIEHAGAVDAFSAPLGRYATTLTGTYTLKSDLTVAIATSGTTPAHAYSACTNQWVTAPAIPNAQTEVTWASAFVVDPSGGLHGFSAHTGTWAQVAAPPSDSIAKSHAMFLAQSGKRLDAFNPRLAKWTTTYTDAPVTSVTTFDQALMAIDRNTVWCYCLFSDEWSSQTLASAIAGTQVRDELCIAYDAGTLHVFGASDQLSNVAIFPYYWRVLARGGPLTYHLAGRPNDLSLLLLNTKGTWLPVPPFGTLQVDLAGALLLPIPPLPAEGILRLAMTIPDDPALAGLTLHAQAIVVDPALTYLTVGNQVTIY